MSFSSLFIDHKRGDCFRFCASFVEGVSGNTREVKTAFSEPRAALYPSGIGTGLFSVGKYRQRAKHCYLKYVFSELNTSRLT
jgi:hypothetical protein